MKLVSCYIENYGKLLKKEIIFEKGITQIYEHNGAGKSTLASFIKAMFYGLASYTTKSKSFEDRQHFCPFGANTFGGSITFEMNDAIYRIERTFDKKSETKDELKVFKNDIPTDELGKDIGLTIFGIDEDAFAKTIFLSSTDISIETTSSINAKLNHFSMENDDENNYETVISILENASKRIKPLRGNNGILPELQAKINSLHIEIENLEAVNNSLNEKYIERSAVSKKINDNDVALKKVHQNEIVNEKYKTYKDLCLQVSGMETKIKEIQTSYPKGFPEEQEFDAIYSMEKAEISLSSKIEELNNTELSLKKEAEEIKERINQNETELEILPNTTTKSALPNVVCILSIVFIAIGIVLGITVSYILTAIFSVLGIGSLILGAYKIYAYKKSENEKRIEWEKYNNLVKQRQEENKKNYENVISKCSEKETEKEKTMSELIKNTEEIELILSKYSLKRDNVREAQVMSRQLRETTSMYKYHKSRADKYKNDNGLEDDYVLDNLQNSNELYSMQSSLRKSLADIDREIMQDEAMTEQLESKQNELLNCQEELKEYKEKYDLFSETTKNLKEAQQNMQNRYVLPVKKAFCKYAEKISKDASEKVVLDGNFNVQFEENGAYRSNKHLSSGQRSIWAICFRLALIDNMYEKEKPFLILDDPFMHLDEDNMKKMSEVIKALTEDMQIIYFNCHDSRNLNI